MQYIADSRPSLCRDHKQNMVNINYIAQQVNQRNYLHDKFLCQRKVVCGHLDP